RVRTAAQLEGPIGDRMADRVDRGAAGKPLFELQAHLVPATGRGQHAHRLRGHFASDAVSRDDGDAMGPDGPHESASTRSLSNTYSRLSTSACQDASTTFSETPTVPHVRTPSVDWISTRTFAAVAASAFSTRTL